MPKCDSPFIFIRKTMAASEPRNIVSKGAHLGMDGEICHGRMLENMLGVEYRNAVFPIHQPVMTAGTVPAEFTHRYAPVVDRGLHHYPHADAVGVAAVDGIPATEGRKGTGRQPRYLKKAHRLLSHYPHPLGIDHNNNDEAVINDRQGNYQAEIDFAIEAFKRNYEI